MNLDEYHANFPFSFSGRDNVYRAHPNVSRKELNRNLAQSDSYSKFKQYKKIKTSPVYVWKKRELFQADLAFFTNPQLVEATGGIKYLLVIIDCFTKKIWLYPLEDKSVRGVVEKFKDLFDQKQVRPERIQTDEGGEFMGSQLGKLFKEYNIHHYVTYSDRKASIVERVIRTLKNLLYKKMEFHNTYNWVELLDDVEQKYLSSYHRTIKMTPNQAELQQNQFLLRLTFHENYSKYNFKRPKFKVGDRVRVSLLRGKFAREFMQRFSEEFFIISHIAESPPDVQLPAPRYYLTDINGDILKGNPSFFENDLSLYIPNEKTRYKVDKIIGQRIRNKKKQYLVTWRGWPENTATWEDADNIENI